jgi:N-sulfoglucosamine sulfohydrolase
MLGQSQIRSGAHEHRSSRGEAKVHLPGGMKLLPQIMKENGYYTFNRGKTDYNFVWDAAATYAEGKLRNKANAWNVLKENQPFFGQIQTKGGKNNTGKFPKGRKTDPAKVTVPADYPRNEVYRNTVAQHYDAIRVDDDVIGKIMGNLKEAGLLENTIVAYFSDHGAPGLVRHKQMVTEGGLHVPFIVTGPEKYVPAGAKVREDLVNMLDLCATTLAWAGIEKPDWYEGQDLFGTGFKPRDFVAAAKDRMDHTLDRCRTVRSDRFRYTRNYKLDRIFLQPQYRDGREYTKNLRELYAAGKLAPKLREIYFGERPAEELYDVSEDPHQVNNLTADPAYATELERHRKLLDGWLAAGDKGEGEEPVEEMRYNADGKKWGTGVNPEYEVYRADSDGDGLSDTWEKVNGRDPTDGRLRFEFDCGGWQTEGWEAQGFDANIAGLLGYLDFPLDTGKGALRRGGLLTDTRGDDEFLFVKLRSSETLDVRVFANDRPLGKSREVEPAKSHAGLKWRLSPDANWQGVIRSLRLEFAGKKGAFVEIDAIEVLRN